MIGRRPNPRGRSGCREGAQSVAVPSAMGALAEEWSTRFLPAPAVAIRAAVQTLQMVAAFDSLIQDGLISEHQHRPEGRE